ncbi:substrate-binding domain-containing protein [Paracoccus sp. Z330]|uniref:Substrate-binding domain-containing protein n=1 Tax=Paracoccus onchidii TaxID=3017813 RepID=A0ABT4ZDM9_9RHOB|nr:substrate-binding domain-containing protein [Paracoccus onchidii]MDB6177441.1 substrate-binding domain-containing protein [Paracoccus onchidii]
MGKRQVSARDVAQLAGVSRTAVSRAFTPGASVAKETRARIEAAAEQLGYQVNHLARGLITANTGLVALIAAEVQTPYRSALLAALTEQLQAAGKIGLLINTDRSDASVAQALKQAIAYRTDAAIVLSGMPDSSLTETCLRNGMQLVLINRDDERAGTLMIRVDDIGAGRQAFAALAAAGCRHIALANSAAGTASLQDRAIGFRQAAAEAGQKITEAEAGPTSYQTGLDLGTGLLSRKDRPDGIFCTTDLIACGVMDAARTRLRLKIPDEVSVIGFDDIEQAGWESYALTTFRQPVEDLARTAVGSLVDLAREHNLQARKTLPVQMIWRGTIRR